MAKMNCKKCRFYREHILFGIEKCEYDGISCEITRKYIKPTLKQEIAVERLNEFCPLRNKLK